MKTNRRDFLKCGAFAAAAGVAGVVRADQPAASSTSSASSTPSAPEIVKHDAAPRNRCPYDGVDWASAQQVNTTTHGHCLCQKHLDCYLRHGFRFITMSNYYPGAPRVPGKTFRSGYYRVHHDFPVMVNGKRTEGPFDWNEIIRPWAGELGEREAKQFPFKGEGQLMFPNWPDDLLEAPNGEHYGFLLANGKPAGSLHLCAPGSNFKSGTFDAHDKFKTKSHGYYFGSGEFWGTAIDRMLAELVDPEGGGVTINHPSWTHLDRKLFLEILDWDPRVLGCEVMEHGFNSEHYWDWALATGRQCYGLFVPDWGFADTDRKFGVNVLVVPELTVHECLKAYRLGNFYGAEVGLGDLRFTRIAYDGKTVIAETDRDARFELKTARGVRATAEGRRIEWNKPVKAKGVGSRQVGTDIFARVKAYAKDSDEVLYSQAFML